ncbi:MAG: protein translocase subunit SecD [Spirochaetales bacterium]|nr:protein translocase subunit SecD [Spirochaetales bacterium]
MSKRFRFLIILATLIVAGIFLFPTFQWYVLVDAEKKQLSVSTKDYIRDYVENKSKDELKALENLLLKPYTVSNVKKASLLLKRIKSSQQEEKVTQYSFLKQRVSDRMLRIIEGFHDDMSIDDTMMDTIVSELNTILEGPLFYDPDVFKDIPLSKRTRNTAEALYSPDAQPANKKYIRINRTIIEELFPEEITDILLPNEFKYFRKNIDQYYKSIKEKKPAHYTVTSLFKSFIADSKMLEVMQDALRKEILGLKELRMGILQAGLDLLGGMKVTMEIDFEAGLPKPTEKPAAEEGSDVVEEGSDAAEETTEVETGTTAANEETPGTISDEEKELEMKKVLEILNNRIDQFGVTEPQIRSQGNNRIIVELPGLADPERIRGVIMGKGRLNFHIIDEAGTEALTEYIKKHPNDYLDRNGNLKDTSFLSLDTVWRQVVEKDKYGIDQRTGFAVIEKEPGLSGEYIENATVQQDPQTMRPTVTFSLGDKGTKIFADLTTEHEKDILAVVLDDKVKFSARISEPIKNGRVQVRGQGIGYQEASDLALILRTGSLRFPLEIIAQEAVGASLGEDAIRQGLYAMLLGILLIIGFMLIYYRGGGVIANIALLLNFILMAGALSVFNFTLTLPSIAGFILTVGMAVDANVIIFERIKEEYMIGKSRKASITAGFSKAFLTIMDANITTGIAAVALAFFGKGAVQGFAVVLIFGIVFSMFTALFVARLLFDFVTETLGATRLSLSWRVSK